MPFLVTASLNVVIAIISIFHLTNEECKFERKYLFVHYNLKVSVSDKKDIFKVIWLICVFT